MMKKLAALVAGVLMMAAGSAFATPVLTLSDGITTKTVTGADNQAIFYGSIGVWKYNVTAGLFGDAMGFGAPRMDLSSQDSNAMGSGPGTLTISFKDTITAPWVGPGGNIRINGNSDTAGFAQFQAFISPDGTLANRIEVSNLLASNISDFDLDKHFTYTPSGNETIELIATITHLGKGSTSFDYIVTPVPEPGTMMLLGAGFLGLAIYGKRRRNA